MSDVETQGDAVDRVAGEALSLLAGVEPASAMDGARAFAASALQRLGALLNAELRAPPEDDDLRLRYARSVVETWLTGHASLLLGKDGWPVVEHDPADPRAAPPLDAPPTVGFATLLHLARQLDEHVYGVTEPPKAFQRHLRSFFEEIDVRRVDRTRAVVDVRTEPGAGISGSRSARTDVLRVSLWVVLFLSRDYFDALGDVQRATQAYELFRQLRDATAAFYQERSRS